MVLSREEKEKMVLDLYYNKGYTYKQLTRELRMSPNQIREIIKRHEENNDSTENQDQIQKKTSTSSQAYRLFSEGKTPLDVAIELNLRELQATKYYREYYKLRGLYKLNLVYEEIKDGITDFLKLHRLSKAAGWSTEHVINLLKIVNNNLPALENRYKKLQRNVNDLESKELDLSINLEDLKSQIQNTKQILDSHRLSCQKEASKMLQLHRQNMRLGRLLTGFKHNNKDYIKIQLVARQTVKNALSDKKQLLKLALHSLIESWHADPTKFSSLIHSPSPASTISKSIVMNHANSNNYHAIPFSSYYNQNSYAENLIEIIVNGAANLYEKMVKDFTNETIANAAASTNSNLLLSMTHLD
jgi:hypothetical protein